MTLVVLLILAVLWAVVLVPPVLRARTERTSDSIGDFNYRLGVLSRTNGGAPAPRLSRTPSFPAVPSMAPMPAAATAPRSPYVPQPSSAAWAAKRRRDIVTGLVAAATLSLLAAYVSGASVLWAAHVLVDVLLAVYLGLWAWVRSAQMERAEKVRYLPQQRMPELALRRTASS